MHLSRLTLNPRDRRVQREIAQPYEMHRTLMKAFGGAPPNGADLAAGDERVLFRLEPASSSHSLVLLVQSLNRPDWSWLAEPGMDGYLAATDESNPAVKSFELELAAGQVLGFRLRANPTVKRRFPGGDHKRVGLHGEEEQMAWLRRKGDQGGFEVLSARISDKTTVHSWIRRDEKRYRLQMLSVQFDGLLKVTDAERLWQSVRKGVGSGKGMGFGLLSLAPALT